MKTPAFFSILSLSRLLSAGRQAFLFALGALLVFGLAFAVPTNVAFAATASPAQSNASLTKAFQHDLSWLNVQQTNLGKANNVVAVVQNLITQADNQSIDTTALASALNNFQSQLATALTFHDSASAVLSAHNGFDAGGNVTDPVAATATVQAATSDLQNAHKDLVAAMQYLIKAVKNFAKANPTFFTKIDGLTVSYLDEQAWLTGQQANLNKANTVVKNVQNLITVAQANNLTTTLLSDALSTFQTRLTAAQASDTGVAGILSTHAGFDAGGNVTDPSAAAATTVNTARTGLQSAHNSLVHSGDLLLALTLWHDTRHISSSSPVVPAYKLAHQSTQALYDSVKVELNSHVQGLLDRLNNLLNVLSSEI
jgi:ribosomal protein L17